MITLELVAMLLFLSLVHCQEFHTLSANFKRQRKRCFYRELENGVSIPQAVTYPSGITVLYACRAGYELDVNIVSARATCYDGVWDRGLPNCIVSPFRIMTTPPTSTAITQRKQQPLECSSLKLANGVIKPERPPYKTGKSVSFQCNDGYERNGTEITICLHDGTWAFPPPTCTAKWERPEFCTGRRLQNGKSDPDKLVYSSQEAVVYKCDVGYALKGEVVAACFFGQWSSNLPICEKKNQRNCKPPIFAHGKIHPKKSTYKNLDAIRYTCESGYSLRGERTAACYKGKWTSKYPRCEDRKKMCRPPIFTQGTIHPLKALYGNLEVIRYTCDAGFNLVGKRTSACFKGKWTSASPRCEASRQYPEAVMHCGPPSIADGSYTPQREYYTVGSEITIRCNKKYFTVGPRMATCQENGNWSELANCQSGCKEPFIVNGYYNTQADKMERYFSQGSVLTIKCNPGYALSGDGTVRCEANFQWRNKLPFCRRLFITTPQRGCEPPSDDFATYSPQLPHGKIRYSIGDHITFTCIGDTAILGHNVAVCQSGGKWSRKPSCPTGCQEPHIVNGYYNTQAVKVGQYFPHGSVIAFDCNRGYQVYGEKSARCGVDNKWSNEVSICKRHFVTTQDERGCTPPSYNFVTYSPQLPRRKGVYSVGDRITFYCNGGEFEFRHNFAYCLSNGQWSRQPSCPTGCKEPIIINGYYNTRAVKVRQYFSQGSVIIINCNLGYYLQGNGTVQCSAKSKWERRLPICKDIVDKQPRRCLQRHLEHGISIPDNTIYPSGTTVQYVCNPGYAFEEDISSAKATCDNGNWDKELPRCVVIFVPTTTPASIRCKPPKLDHGIVKPPNPPYSAGQSVAFRCNDGYERKGTSISICLDDGTWALPMPKCEAKEKKLKACIGRTLQNGKSNPEKSVYQSRDVVIYKCNDGYSLIGDEAAACFLGKWTAKLPYCEKKKEKVCKPPPFAHGTIFPKKNTYKNLEVIRYSCGTGYSIKGKGTAACYQGKWSSKFPRCEDSQQFPEVITYCEPPSIEHGSYSPQLEQYAVGADITILCKTGYFVSGVRKAICQESGMWTELAVCDTGCKEPVITHGFYNTQAVKVGQYFTRGSVVIINCNPGYVLEGEGRMRCGSNNKWGSKAPICKSLIVTITERGCEPPFYDFATYSPNLPQGKDVYSVGDRITFICNGDETALGHNFANCMSNGKWSRNPSCSKKCRRPVISNGRIDKSASTFSQNSLIRVICDEGYLAVGQKTARCRYNGLWSMQLQCSDGCYRPKITGLKVSPAPYGGGNVYEFGKRVTFRCDAGFSFSTAQCQGKNRWDKALPSCKLISDTSVLARSGCSKPKLSEGLLMKNPDQAVYPYKTQFEFQCARGFNMIGSAVSICRKHLNGPLGGLDPRPPRCDRVKCGSPGKPQNGRFRDGDKGSYLYEDTVYYVCDDKHIMSGNDRITCQADGQFNGIPPKCQPPSCRVECVYVDGRECQCDATCRIRGDCCYDFEQHCRKLFY